MTVTVGHDSQKTRQTLTVAGKSYSYFSIPAAQAAGLGEFSRLPAALKVVLENMLRFEDGRKAYEVVKTFEGVVRNLEKRLNTESTMMREELERYQSPSPCEVCHGDRLRPEALSVKIAGETISTAVRRPVGQALASGQGRRLQMLGDLRGQRQGGV